MRPLALTALCAIAWAAAGTPRIGRIVVASNGRFLEHTDHTPFFWLGDTAWALFEKLNREEVERYLDNRRAKGFNVIQAVALHVQVRQPIFGEPLIDRNPLRPNVTPGNDPSKPGEYDYWDHVDWVIDEAAKRGIYIAVLPCWGNVVNTGMLNPENAAGYVRWLAGRYASKQNLFWILGGDTPADRNNEVWTAMGRALREADPAHLITFHPFGRTQSSTWFHNEPWLDFNMFQSGHRRYGQDPAPGAKEEDNWKYVAEDYARTPVKPTLDGEPSYENIPQGLHDPSQPYWQDSDVRRYAYWSVFAGAFGHTYGDNAVEQMYKPGQNAAFGARNYWYEAIDDPGSGQMQFLKRLILSRPFFERIPDQSAIVGSNGNRYDYVAITRGRSYLFAYVYSGRQFELRLGMLTGKTIRATWYGPRDGRTLPAGVFPNRGVRKFTPPEGLGIHKDWVLVLDDNLKHFPAPGGM
jgi:hypothetical protein